MKLERPDLDAAEARGLVAPGQAQALWDFLQQRAPADETPRFKPAHILYYLGGLIAIGAMSLFMTLGWERLGGAGILALSLAYAVLAVALTEWLLHRKHLRLPAGLTATLGVVMVPLSVYGAQQALGLAIVGVGVWWQRHEAALQARMMAMVPAAWRRMLAHRHATH